MTQQITREEYEALMAALARHAPPRQPTRPAPQRQQVRLVRDAPGMPTFLALALGFWPLALMYGGIWNPLGGWIAQILWAPFGAGLIYNTLIK